MRRVMLMLPCAKYITLARPIKKVILPLDLIGKRRFICVETYAQNNPASSHSVPASIPQQQSSHPISAFLQRVHDSYNLLILLNERPWNEDTLLAVQSSNATVSPYVLSLVIKWCVDLDTALEFYKWSTSIYGGECIDSRVYAAIILRLGYVGRSEEMEAVASECESKGMATVTTFTVQMAAYKQVKNLDGALRTWKRMEKFGLKPNLVSFTVMISSFATFKMYDEAANLYLLALWEKLNPSVRMLTAIIYHLALAGKMDSAKDIFSDMCTFRTRPTALTYAILMKGYARLGDISAIIDLVRELKDSGFRTHRDVFTVLFEEMMEKEKREDAFKIMLELWPELSSKDLKGLLLYYHSASKKSGFNEHGDVFCSSEASDISDDEEVVDNFSINPFSLWNFTSFVHCISPWTTACAAALDHSKIKWNGDVVAAIIKRFKNVDAGWKFFNWVEGQQGFTHDKFTYSAMIRLLLQNGNFAIVKQLFLEAQSKQLSLPLRTYNKVLTMCGVRREADVALDVFGLLDSAGLKPDSSFYQNLIHTLYRCGRFWRAATVFAEMQNSGVVPTAATYSDVVSGFAEAGHMKYAKAYYAKMRAGGFEPSDRLLGSLISGFYLIGRLDRAEQVFQQMRRDNMEPPAAVYDLMIKVFRRAGKSVELRQVQDLRKSVLPYTLVEKQQSFVKYLKFYRIFQGSFAQHNDTQLYATS
ncbi:hypothetical protein L7F22_045049 [Adiantum nelumboides]|nr:hypothetical protein [Adiantum nelumboides]